MALAMKSARGSGSSQTMRKRSREVGEYKYEEKISESGAPKKKAKKESEMKTTQRSKQNWKNKKGKLAKKPIILTNKEAHLKVKATRIERKKLAQGNRYDTITEMKVLWENLRRHDTSAEQRNTLCNQMYELVKGKEVEFLFAHDTSRILQCLYKHAQKDMRTSLFNSLKGAVEVMAKSQYSTFLVKLMLRKGSEEERNFIIAALTRNAARLLVHKVAGSVLELAYSEFVDAKQKKALLCKFYGPPLLHIDDSLSLNELMELKPEKKPGVLDFLKRILQKIVEKTTLNYSLVHKLFLDYFMYSDNIDRQAMAECLQERICDILHTSDGVRAAMFTIWYSSAKGRKSIVKQLRGYIDKILLEENGHLILLATFDAIDDTTMVSQLILRPMCKQMSKLISEKWGRRVLMYLLQRRDPNHFNKDLCDFLALGDSNPFSKKDISRRSQELLDEVSPALLEYMEKNMKTILSDGNSDLKVLMWRTLTKASGDNSNVLDSLVRCYNKPYSKKHVVEDKCLSYIVGNLVRKDDSGKYAEAFINGIDSEFLTSFKQSDRGSLFLDSLVKAAKTNDVQAKIADISEKEKYKKDSKDGKKSSKSA